LAVTQTLEQAIAAAASMGWNKPKAAIGIPTTL